VLGISAPKVVDCRGISSTLKREKKASIMMAPNCAPPSWEGPGRKRRKDFYENAEQGKNVQDL